MGKMETKVATVVATRMETKVATKLATSLGPRMQSSEWGYRDEILSEDSKF